MGRSTTRRGFLGALAAAAAGAGLGAAGLIDTERLLWTPGQRTHFLPPTRGWLFNGQLIMGFDPGYGMAQQYSVLMQQYSGVMIQHASFLEVVNPVPFKISEAWMVNEGILTVSEHARFARAQQQLYNQLQLATNEAIAAGRGIL